MRRSLANWVLSRFMRSSEATDSTVPITTVPLVPITPIKSRSTKRLKGVPAPSANVLTKSGQHSLPPKAPDLILTPDQDQALKKIEGAYEPGGIYLLTGHAGSGKSTLIQILTKHMIEKNRSVVLTAPTHKAVAVLEKKLKEAQIQNVLCRTIHSVLSLKPKPHADQLVFERDRHANPVFEDVVVIDECSMVSEDLYRHIKRNLPNAFVVFVGDPAQLPPIGEVESRTFSTKNTAHLTTIVRQAADSPILAAAAVIRASQGGQSDLSWCKPAFLENGHGIFLPGDDAQRWMRKAFTSSDFDGDPDSFRYLAWTNRRVHEVNQIIRRWRYGDDIPTPFMPGESCLFREPLVINETMIFSNNQETKVVTIKKGAVNHKFEKANGVAEWMASLRTWEIGLQHSDGSVKTVHMPADNTEFQKVIARIKDEAAEARIRWHHLHEFQQSLAQLQSIYSLTVHRSQGSTFGTVFVDLPDIRCRETDNLLEAQQLLYVAVTRPSQRLVIVEA